jgi:hypothetical protein
LLEKELNARPPSKAKFEVWNLAVPGYNSVQEVATFAAKADSIRPDLVIVNWVGNDMDLPNFPSPSAPTSTVRVDRSCSKLMRRRWRAWRGKRVSSPTLVPVPFDESSRLPSLTAEEVPAR